jgi:hypothetical protein
MPLLPAMQEKFADQDDKIHHDFIFNICLQRAMTPFLIACFLHCTDRTRVTIVLSLQPREDLEWQSIRNVSLPTDGWNLEANTPNH